MKYIINKGVGLSTSEKILVLVLAVVLIMFGLILNNNSIGIDLMQKVIAG